ncbi:hypothetical protein HHL23_06985 [Chryseobacterium sp. RP-3-3]|uniref:Uncharacterized protein n=1 Tax=Chryseobacterium antibioticum TaxID=2728847 RepID=A0A7Y0FQT5_9FLAO|nr:hypothetical protein [Chryseobacterium antibioticum]NML69537.1 hypothetical protein [Chryseobacterium antibioticum]
MSPKLFKAIKSLWILLLIYIVLDFAGNYFYPEKDNTLSKVLDDLSYALSSLFFLWYFLINRRWKSVLMILPFLLVFFFFMKEIRNMVDYYVPFEETINSDTLRTWTYLIIQFLATFMISKRYLVEEEIHIKHPLLKVFLLNMGLFTLYNTDLGLIEKVIGSASYNSKSTEFIVNLIYYTLSSIKSVAYLGAFLFLTACLAQRENLYTFSKNALQTANDYFGPAVLIVISCIIFSFGGLLESAFSLELDFFGKDLTLSGWMNMTVLVVFFVICTRFTGQLIKERSLLKQKYYGVAGASVWVPLINIIALLMIRFDDKIKFLAPSNLEKAKKIHLAIISLLVIFQFRNGLLEKKVDDILMCVIYITAFWVVGYIKKFTWLFPIILGAVVTVIKVYPFYNGVYAQEFVFKDYVLDLFKHTFSIALVLTVIVFYGIYYIAYQALNTKK